MHIDLIAPEQWENLNDKISASFQLDHETQARAFAGLSHAIYELSQGAMQFYSHKRSIGFIKGQTWAFDFMLANLLREAIQVQSHDYSTLQIVPWVEQLKKDTNFVFFAEDHPVTGEIYQTDELNQLLNDKKIFAFSVSHSRHLYSAKQLLPFSARICSYADRATVVFCGERVRSSAQVAHKMSWNHSQFLSDIANAKKRSESQFLVEEFEAKMHSNQFLANNVKRIFDRAVLCFQDVSAEALAMQIFKKMNLPSEQGWKLVGTTNQCYWQGLNMYKTWWLPQPKPEQLRGLILFSCEILETKDFANIVKTAYEELKALQTWSV